MSWKKPMAHDVIRDLRGRRWHMDVFSRALLVSTLVNCGSASTEPTIPAEGIGKASQAVTSSAPLVNLALNPSCNGFPSPLSSSAGWGGGSNPCDIVDGLRSYDTWARGLAFTGGHETANGGPPWIEPAGVRYAVIDFGQARRFEKVVIWWHGAEYTPETGVLEYWDGIQWLPIPSVQREYGTMHEEGSNSGYSDSDIYTFPAVQGSKVRYSFDNSGNNILGTLNIHGWIYEMEVWGTMECAPGLNAVASLHSDFGVLFGIPKPWRIGLEDVFPGFVTLPSTTGETDITCHLETRNNRRELFIGPRLPWPLSTPVPAPFPIGVVAPDVDLDYFAEGHALPQRCQFDIASPVDTGCLLNDASSSPRLVRWKTPGFRLNVLGVPSTLQPREFWVDLSSLPGVAPDAALSVTVDAVEDIIEARIAANIVFAQSYWALIAEPPVDVLVSDPRGRRTGLFDDGSVLTEIPASTHFRAGDLGAVLLYRPEEGGYSARIMGKPEDPFSLSIVSVDMSTSTV